MLWKLPGGVLLLHRRAQPLWWVHAAVQWLWGHLGWAVVVGAVVLLGWMWLHPRIQLRRLLPKQLPWLWVGADGRVRGCSEGFPFALELRAMLREQSGLPSSFLHRLERARQSAHPHCWLWESTRDGQRREYLGYALPVRRWGVRGTICIILEVTQAVQERMGFYWKGLAHDVSNKLALLPEGSERQVLRQLQRNLRTLERLHPDSAQANSPREQVRLDELIAELCAEECQGLEDVEVVQRCMPVQLWANRELLKRALENALWNALKAVRQSERRQVVLRAYRRHREVVVEVEDSGPGLPQGLREGMGMRIMRWVVEGEHGGRLEFERGQNGQGTLVRFRFPKVLLNRVRNGDTA
jgi:signal transduction histidine kinase